jgi:hypothetical protein
MTLARWSAWTGAILAALALGGVVVTLLQRGLGVGVTTMPDTFAKHVGVEERWHAVEQADDSLVQGKADELSLHLRHMEMSQRKVEAVFFAEQCLENPYEMLVAQQLIRTCDSLGIRRTATDSPPP